MIFKYFLDIIITHSKVWVETYKPFIMNGKEYSKGNWKSIAVNEVDIIAEIENIISNFGGDIAYGGGYSLFTGNPIDNIRAPWVLSNLEEIIIDETFLFSKDFSDAISVPQAIQVYQSKNIRILGKDSLSSILKRLAYGKKVNSKDQFKRFHTISIVPGLYDIIKDANVSTFYNRKLGSVYKSMVDSQLINPSNCITSSLNKSFIDTGEIVTRSYYKFDSEVLIPFSRRFGNELKAQRQQDANEAAAAAAEKMERSKNPFEKELDRISETYGEHVAQMAYRVCAALNARTRDEIDKGFTPNGLSKYTGGN